MNLVQFKRHDGDGDVFINPAHVAMVEQSGTGDANVTDVVVAAQAGLALVRVQEPQQTRPDGGPCAGPRKPPQQTSRAHRDGPLRPLSSCCCSARDPAADVVSDMVRKHHSDHPGRITYPSIVVDTRSDLVA